MVQLSEFNVCVFFTRKKVKKTNGGFTVVVALQASPLEAQPVSSSSCTALAKRGTLGAGQTQTLIAADMFSSFPSWSSSWSSTTHRWFSLLGPKESLMSLCRWMARWGILRRGLGTWMSLWVSLSPL